jgi:hypothetical protein
LGSAVPAPYDDLLFVGGYEHPDDIGHGRAARRAPLAGNQAAHDHTLPERWQLVG